MIRKNINVNWLIKILIFFVVYLTFLKLFEGYEDMMDFEEVTFEKAEKSKEIKKCIDNSNNVIVNVRNIEVDMEPVKKIEPLTAFTKKVGFVRSSLLFTSIILF